jgi:GxxExxY protein
MSLRDRINGLTEGIIGTAIQVHRELGIGLLENAYEACLQYELRDCGMDVDRQLSLPVVYRDVRVDCGYRLDLLVNRLVIVELKCVEKLNKIHEAQMHTCLKLTNLNIGLILNFSELKMVDGVKRIIRGTID